MLNVFANRTQRSDFVISELERRGFKDCEVFIAVAFFTEAEVVKRLVEKGCKIRLVVRLGFPTSPSALEAVKGKVDLRVYTSMSFHPKLYIFGDEVALVGSANLTHRAITSNQEVVVGIAGDDERFAELAAIFQNYWDDADVPTDEMLRTYAAAYKTFEAHENAADRLSREIAQQHRARREEGEQAVVIPGELPQDLPGSGFRVRDRATRLRSHGLPQG